MSPSHLMGARLVPKPMTKPVLLRRRAPVSMRDTSGTSQVTCRAVLAGPFARVEVDSKACKALSCALYVSSCAGATAADPHLASHGNGQVISEQLSL
eukprot:2513309-Pleurochrysis_carterae.AAC.1